MSKSQRRKEYSDSEQSSSQISSVKSSEEYRQSQPQNSSFNYHDILDNMLKQYQDIDDDQIQICQKNLNPFQSISQTYMHNTHRTLVPIGGNFQVLLPPILTPEAYKIKSAPMLKAIKILKVNDPVQGQQFFHQYFKKIDARFGPGRSYEDVNHLRNAFKRMHSQLSFDDYLNKNGKYWENYFKAKDRTAGPKMPVKKKKKKGTIPI